MFTVQLCVTVTREAVYPKTSLFQVTQYSVHIANVYERYREGHTGRHLHHGTVHLRLTVFGNEHSGDTKRGSAPNDRTDILRISQFIEKHECRVLRDR